MYQSFDTIRTFSALAAADSAPTSASAWVNLGSRGKNSIEVRWGSGAVTGSPTSVTFSVWRKFTAPTGGGLAGTSGGTVYIDRVYSKTILLADIAQATPDIVDFYGTEVFVTLASFDGGTTPAVTMTVQARYVETDF